MSLQLAIHDALAQDIGKLVIAGYIIVRINMFRHELNRAGLGDARRPSNQPWRC